MLELDRKIGQRVFINKGKIQIEILKIEGDMIKIGFSAPPHIDIHREELHVRKRRQRNKNMR